MKPQTRYNRISIRPSVGDAWMFYDINLIQFQKDLLNRDYYIVKEHELGIVSEYEQSPGRCIEIAFAGDYLYKDQLGNLKIIPRSQINNI